MNKKKSFILKPLLFLILILILLSNAKSQTIVRKKIFKLINIFYEKYLITRVKNV